MTITYAIAHAAGTDAGNRSARRAGRKAWSRKDYDAARRTFTKLTRTLTP